MESDLFYYKQKRGQETTEFEVDHVSCKVGPSNYVFQNNGYFADIITQNNWADESIVKKVKSLDVLVCKYKETIIKCLETQMSLEQRYLVGIKIKTIIDKDKRTLAAKILYASIKKSNIMLGQYHSEFEE